MEMETREQVGGLVAELSASAWALASLDACLEAGLLEYLTEPHSPVELSERTGVPAALVEALLDLLAALGLVRRAGDAFTAAPGLQPFLTPPARDYLLRDVRATVLQNRALIEGAKRGTLRAGWTHTDPELLEAQGAGSTGAPAARMLSERLFPRLEGLVERLQAPTASFLDVGFGVGALSIEMCRIWPHLRVVGLEPQAAPLAEGQRNVAAAGLGERIALRAQWVEEMTEREAFDLAWLPQVFLPQEAFGSGLRVVREALRPGGWAILLAIGAPGSDPRAALGRLINVLWGGEARSSEEVERAAIAAGFDPVRSVPGSPGGLTDATFVVARRPT
ncbi:MAG TPA: class I SAM-dependent methyltransferase [Ktedonobacterales bacterium]|jgi:SAM-dependent methyltransferase